MSAYNVTIPHEWGPASPSALWATGDKSAGQVEIGAALDN